MPTLDELDALVSDALKEGARAAEVYCRTADCWQVVSDGGGTPLARQSTEESLVVRVWVPGGRVGEMKGTWDQGPELVGQALASTFESAESVHAGPAQRLGGAQGGLGVLDRRQKHLTADDRIAVVADSVNQAKGPDSSFHPGRFTYTEKLEWRGIANSRGVHAEEEATAFRLEGALRARDLELREHMAARTFASIASLPMGTRLVNRALALLEPRGSLPSGPVRVVLPPLPMSRILEVLGEHFTPKELGSKSFFLSPHEAGEAVLHPKLHVVDDGARPGALRSRSFDDRGIPPVPLTLIREGRIDARFLDPEAARVFETRPTGHSFAHGLGASNLLMRGGTRSINALLTELDGPSFKVDDLSMDGLNLKTGAFEATVNGTVMAANKPTGALCGVRLHGNLADLLSNIVDVGNDTDRIGHVDAAAIIAEGLFLDV